MESVQSVLLTADAFYSCLTHAFSNDEEEVMGLCIGETKKNPFGCEVHVLTTMCLRRLDRRKDRVEISVEQLSQASTEVEKLSCQYGKKMRIVGWYHSHPGITVWPSHIDTDTQAMYQMMDGAFIGLIFSCFNEHKPSSKHSVQVTCFQSKLSSEWNKSRLERVEIAIAIGNRKTMGLECRDALKELPRALMQEENDALRMGSRHAGDILTSLHNSSVHIQSLSKLNNILLLPIIQALGRRNLTVQVKTDQIREQNTLMSAMLEKLKSKVAII